MASALERQAHAAGAAARQNSRHGIELSRGNTRPAPPNLAFFKSPDAINGPGDTIVLPDLPRGLFHHEGETVRIFGKKGTNISSGGGPSNVWGTTPGTGNPE